MKATNFLPFFKWWLTTILFSFGLTLFGIYGGFDLLLKSDITYISFFILVSYIILSIRIGITTYMSCKKEKTCNWQDFEHDIELSQFASDKFLTLGMIGTVIGFIYMLTTGMGSIEVSNPETMQNALIIMSKGMGTALLTTATGLICGFLLKIQLYNITKQIRLLKDE